MLPRPRAGVVERRRRRRQQHLPRRHGVPPRAQRQGAHRRGAGRAGHGDRDRGGSGGSTSPTTTKRSISCSPRNARSWPRTPPTGPTGSPLSGPRGRHLRPISSNSSRVGGSRCSPRLRTSALRSGRMRSWRSARRRVDRLSRGRGPAVAWSAVRVPFQDRRPVGSDMHRSPRRRLVECAVLSLRFRAWRAGDFNEYVYNFFKSLSPERMARRETQARR